MTYSISKTWTEMKSLITNCNLKLQYEDLGDNPSAYSLWMPENNIIYTCKITKNTEDAIDFENNYKSTANKSITTCISDYNGSNYMASEGKTIIDINTVTSIDISNGWTEISKINSPDCGFLVTDASMSGNNDGTFRFCIDGNPIKVIYYKAKDYISIYRNLPYYLPADTDMTIEFKPDEDNASVSCCIGGIKNE